MHITTIGLDLAKNIFQACGVTANGDIAFNRPVLRGLIGEFGHIVRKGLNYIRDFAQALKAGDGLEMPDMAQSVIASLCDQLLDLDARIKVLEKEIFKTARKDPRVKLLETIPGIGRLRLLPQSVAGNSSKQAVTSRRGLD